MLVYIQLKGGEQLRIHQTEKSKDVIMAAFAAAKREGVMFSLNAEISLTHEAYDKNWDTDQVMINPDNVIAIWCSLSHRPS